jgi:hypothetical protein
MVESHYLTPQLGVNLDSIRIWPASSPSKLTENHSLTPKLMQNADTFMTAVAISFEPITSSSLTLKCISSLVGLTVISKVWFQVGFLPPSS